MTSDQAKRRIAEERRLNKPLREMERMAWKEEKARIDDRNRKGRKKVSRRSLAGIVIDDRMADAIRDNAYLDCAGLSLPTQRRACERGVSAASLEARARDFDDVKRDLSITVEVGQGACKRLYMGRRGESRFADLSMCGVGVSFVALRIHDVLKKLKGR